MISYEKLKTILDTKFPPATQAEARKCWEASGEIAHCYMLASMTNILYKKLKSYKTAKVILDMLEDMFRGQTAISFL